MTDEEIAAAARRQGLARALALVPDEIRGAAGLVAEQAEAIAALGRNVASTPLPAARPLALAATRDMPASASRPLSLAEIGRGFAARTLDPPTLLEALLARIAAIDGRLDSFVVVDRDGARAAAQASAARWAAGASLGALDGVPIAIKDVIDVAGLATRCHSRTTGDVPAARDADVVARARSAGAVILGKLATHEFAIGGPAFDLPFPPARNPWNREHHPGGSSSGAGAAVAAGLVPLAIGTDTAGSVRNPASACGIVGLKPGLGVLPLGGVVPLAPTLDHVGLLTRDVADMRIAAAALGIDVVAAGRGRVGYVRHFHAHDMVATAEVAAVLDAVAATLDAVEVTLPPLGAFSLVNRIILQSEGFAVHAGRLRTAPEALSRLTRAALLPGAFTAAETLIAAYRQRDILTDAVDAAFRDVDILVTASSMEPACRIDDPAEIARSYMLQARTPFNVTGHPALTMMAGLSAGGLPLSVQFAGRRGEEGRLLAAAGDWERAMGGAAFPPGH